MSNLQTTALAKEKLIKAYSINFGNGAYEKLPSPQHLRSITCAVNCQLNIEFTAAPCEVVFHVTPETLYIFLLASFGVSSILLLRSWEKKLSNLYPYWIMRYFLSISLGYGLALALFCQNTLVLQWSLLAFSNTVPATELGTMLSVEEFLKFTQKSEEHVEVLYKKISELFVECPSYVGVGIVVQKTLLLLDLSYYFAPSDWGAFFVCFVVFNPLEVFAEFLILCFSLPPLELSGPFLMEPYNTFVECMLVQFKHTLL